MTCSVGKTEPPNPGASKGYCGVFAGLPEEKGELWFWFAAFVSLLMLRYFSNYC